MKPKTTIILICILAVCALLAGLAKMGVFDTAPIPAPKDRRLFADRPKQATCLTITGSDGTDLILARVGGKWEIPTQKPGGIPIPVQARMADHLANTILNLEYSRSFDPAGKDGIEDSLTGLDGPVWLVAVKGESDGEKNAKTYTLLVGKQAPQVGGDKVETYVRPEGSSLAYLVTADLGSLLGRSADDYRDRTVITLPAADIREIRVAGKQSYTLEKSGKIWKITSPVAARIKTDAAVKLLDNLTRLEVVRFLADNPKDLGPFDLDKPQLAITVSLAPAKPGKEPASQTLMLGGKRDKNICATLDDKPGVFLLPAKTLDELQPPLAKLRSEIVMDFMPLGVGQITIQREDYPTFGLRRSGGWKFTADLKGPADKQVVDKLLRNLAALKAEKWIESKTGKDIVPTATITLDILGTGKKLTLLIGLQTLTDEKVYIQLVGSKEVALVPAAKIREILRPAAAYLPKVPKPVEK
ncbi:MAG: DUF4340 domain-containing protein [Phycisphaerae bacterium]|nr:DUF4340 domain-containing protein [Phycisphaerae bacterium]